MKINHIDAMTHASVHGCTAVCSRWASETIEEKNSTMITDTHTHTLAMQTNNNCIFYRVVVSVWIFFLISFKLNFFFGFVMNRESLENISKEISISLFGAYAL